MKPRHFLTLLDLEPLELTGLIRRAAELKAMQHRGAIHAPLRGKVLAMIFEKSSTRTRVSFEAGMTQMGGSALFLDSRDTQLGRGETIEDSARVISRMVDCVMIRTFRHETIMRFSEHSSVPVINGLTDAYHPCQLLADIQTFKEHREDLRGRTVTWVGDGNNVCHSWINAARQFDFRLHIASPAGYEPSPERIRTAGDRVMLTNDPMEAARGSDLIVTDVWASMGQEEEHRQRVRRLCRLPGECSTDGRSGAKCPVHALPPGSPWRGSQRRRH